MIIISKQELLCAQVVVTKLPWLLELKVLTKSHLEYADIKAMKVALWYKTATLILLFSLNFELIVIHMMCKLLE